MIHTLTPNPALDLTYRVADVRFDDTVRARSVRREPGGKGINVSRVAARLGHPTVAMGFVGGRAGDEVDDLLRQEGVRTWFTRFSGVTRTNAIVQDDQGQQLRVSGPGPAVAEGDLASLLDALFELRAPDWLALSGSVLRGMPSGFYSEVAARAQNDGVKVMVDADGSELEVAVDAGVDMIKPNRYELERLVGQSVADAEAAVAAARSIVARGVGTVLCSLGADGAVMVTRDGAWRAIAPEVEVDSAVGAGDAMVAGALSAAAEGRSPEAQLRLAIACGSATAITPGTELCHLQDVRDLESRVVVVAID